MKKIMFYINAIHDGGAERVMVNLAKFFSENDYDTVLVTSFRDTWEYPVATTVRRITLEESEVKQSRIKRNWSRIKKLRALCKTEKPDVLVSFMAEPNFRAIIATIGLPVKTIVSVRNDPNQEYRVKFGWFVGKILLPMADGCVFQTSEARRWFPRRLQKRSRIIYNAVKEEFYNVVREPTRGEIVTCGRLTEQKNQKMLIDAFAKVQRDYPFATLKIYGEGALRESLQKQIEDLHLEDKAFLMGATNNVVEALRTADLFVLSSDYEGMPNALMEAMAAGVPCISTDCPCGGPQELLNGNKEFLSEVKDTEDMRNHIELMLIGKNEAKCESMKHLAMKFTPNEVTQSWMRYIDSLIIGEDIKW